MNPHPLGYAPHGRVTSWYGIVLEAVIYRDTNKKQKEGERRQELVTRMENALGELTANSTSET